jgi:hypothetical protein
MPDLEEEVELPSFKEPIGARVTRSPTPEIPESQIWREDSGQESASTTTQEPSNFIFDVFAEGDDEPSGEDRQMSMPMTRVFPSSAGIENLITLPESS